jgi:DNA helicase II / ATP-dependent DNA helicase PcrA
LDKRDFEIEQFNLDETIKRIKDQTYYVSDLVNRKSKLIKEGSAFLGDDVSYSKAKKDSEILSKAIKEPFFGRVDYLEDNELETIYIGKQGVNDKNENQIIVDWRRPIASIYYNFTSGRPEQSYQIDIKGRKQKNFVEVTRKREMTINNSKIIKMTQQMSEIKSKENATFTSKGEQLEVTDDFLREILENSETTGYLKEIIATIQKEQDLAIRQALDKNVIIQGVAGSGKSSIALHRLSYLLFNNKHLEPENVLILGPSKLFINSFKDLLPELDLKGINQTTVQELLLDYLKGIIKKPIEQPQKYYFENLLFNDHPLKQYEYKQIEFKGSEKFILMLDIYIDQLISNYEMRFTNISIQQEYLEVKDLNKIYEGYAYLPFIKRVERFIQHVENHFKNKMELKKNEQKEKFELIKEFMKDDGLTQEEKRIILGQLEGLLNYKIKKIESEFKSKINPWKEKMKISDTLSLYKNCLSYEALYEFKHEIGEEIPEIFKNYRINEITYFDLAPLFYLYSLIEEIPVKFTHIVIDEAQDLSYIHFAALKKITKTMTILGDLDQGIYMNYGQSDWYKLINSFFDNNDDMLLKLKTSYRSTKQIVEAANTVLKNQFGLLHEPITPLNRNGVNLNYTKVSSGSHLLEDIVDTVEAWKHKYKRIAIIHKDEQRAIKLADYLKDEFKSDVVYVNPNEEVKQQSISVLTSYQSKGMEFDAVILVNVNEESYPSDPLHAKLLYVLLTRAQQEVKVYYQDKPSKLLEGLIEKELIVVGKKYDDIL